MRSGLLWLDADGCGGDDRDTIKLDANDAWTQYVLDRTPDADPRTKWQYNDGVSVLIGKILREALAQQADAWANAKLFEPIGIDSFYWKTTPDVEADTEDLARIGFLFLRGGEWNGTQVISRGWAETSTSPVVEHILGHSPLDMAIRSGLLCRSIARPASLPRTATEGSSCSSRPSTTLWACFTAG